MAPSAPPRSEEAVIVGSMLAAVALAVAVSVAVLVSPVVGLVLVLGVGAFLFVVANPRYGIIAVLAAIMLIPEPFNVAAGPVTVSAGRVLLWTLELGWLLQLRNRKRPFTPRGSPFDVPIMVALVTMVLSLVVNVPLLDGVGFIGAMRQTLVFAVDLFLFFFVVHSVLRTVADVEWILRIVAGLIAFTAVLGLVEHLTGQNVFEYITPYLPSRFQEIFDGIARGSAEGLARGHLSRVRSTFEGPLTFGTVLVLGLPLCLAFTVTARSLRDRWPWIIATAAVSAALLLTASRACYLAAALTFVLFVAFAPDNRVRLQASLVGLAVVCLLLSQPTVRDTMGAFLQVQRGGVVEGSVQSRLDDYGPVLSLVAKKPFFGYAPRSFATDALQHNNLLAGRTDLTLDNAYLLTLAETGAVGLLGLAFLLFSGVASAWRAIWATADRARRTLCVALFTAMVSWVLMGFAADVYLFGAPPRLFIVLLAAIAAMREASGWSRRRQAPDLVVSVAPVPEAV
jgi:hypothetical protein